MKVNFRKHAKLDESICLEAAIEIFLSCGIMDETTEVQMLYILE